MTRRGAYWAIEEILGWLAGGAELRVKRTGPLYIQFVAYVTDGRLPRIVLRDEADWLVSTLAVAEAARRGPYRTYRITELGRRAIPALLARPAAARNAYPRDLAGLVEAFVSGGGRGAATPRAAGRSPA